MTTIQFDLGGGASIALPAETVAQRLIEKLRTESKPAIAQPRYRIGEYAPGQGGIFAGDIRGDDGVTYGLITSVEKNLGKAKWGNDGKRDLSDWDGLSNTNHLRNESPAAKLASDYEADGHVDFYLPSQRELMIARANIPHLFEKAYHWTSTPYGSSHAWAVSFGGGSVDIRTRNLEFVARPFRRFTY